MVKAIDILLCVESSTHGWRDMLRNLVTFYVWYEPAGTYYLTIKS